MTIKEFTLPDVGEGVAEGEIVRWLVEPGDRVEEDQPVAEVETDKALVEVPSQYDGIVEELFVEEGEVVPVGDVIISFRVDESDTTEEPTSPGRTFAPPAARRLARELGVDLDEISGSGAGGRISEADVRAHAESGTDEQRGAGDGRSTDRKRVDSDDDASASTTPTTEPADRETTLATPATRKVARELGVDIDDVPTDESREGEAFVTETHVRAYAEGDAEPTAETEIAAAIDTGTAEASGASAETIPYRGVRRTIGEQVERSKYTAPHVTHHDTAEVDALVDAREELKPKAEAEGVKLTYLPFIMKAVVAGLTEHPELNSELHEDDEEIVLKKEYNIGIAVATDAGLLVPVVDGVDEKGLFELAAEVNDLASRARDRTLQPDEMKGGTFSITNFGAIGGEYATPIINYPETAILGLGAIEERPVVRKESEIDDALDAEGGTRVVPAPTLPLSLSIDHRVVDGAVAAAFANTVMDHLESPLLLLNE